MKRAIPILILLTFSGALAPGCASPKNRAEQEVSFGKNNGTNAQKVTQSALQQDLQRFSTVFMDRVGQALDGIRQAKSPAIREEGMRRALLYGTSALDIASETNPELGLLDMLVFITLSRQSLEEYWIPEVLKDEGKGLAQAFDRSEPEIWAIASKVMSPELQGKLKQLIAQWKSENPGQIRVEGVRLSDFSKKAGIITQDRAETTRGLFSNVASGIETVDKALLLADRVMFLAQRYPFLMRMQASLGASEILSSIDTQLEPGGNLEGALLNARSFTELAARAAHEGRLFAESLYPLILPKTKRLHQNLTSANEFAAKSITLLDKLNSASPAAMRELNDFATRIFILLFLLGTAMSAVWWGGYYIVKRRLAEASSRSSARPDSGKKAA